MINTNKQQNHRLRTDNSLGYREWAGAKIYFISRIFTLDSAVVKTQPKCLASMEVSKIMQYIITEKQSNQFNVLLLNKKDS